MLPLISKDLWAWIKENEKSFEPPVGNKVIWEDSQFIAMIVRGPNSRRDFHVDPSEEIFYMLRGEMDLEYMKDGRRVHQAIRQGEILLMPAFTPHSPHRPEGSWGLVVEIKREPEQKEEMRWYCEKCDALVHQTTMQVADIEVQLRQEIERFDANETLRTCKKCGHRFS